MLPRIPLITDENTSVDGMGRQPHMGSSGIQPDATDPPHLSEPAVVDRFIRDLTRTVLHAVSRADFIEYLDFECPCMNDRFLPITPTDKGERGSRNAPDQMGEYVVPRTARRKKAAPSKQGDRFGSARS